MIVFLIVVMYFKHMVMNGHSQYVFTDKTEAVKKLRLIMFESVDDLLKDESMEIQLIEMKEGSDEQHIMYQVDMHFEDEILKVFNGDEA